jgi:hypothetical protein
MYIAISQPLSFPTFDVPSTQLLKLLMMPTPEQLGPLGQPFEHI